MKHIFTGGLVQQIVTCWKEYFKLKRNMQKL
jgi:hypothetical protein